MFHSYVSLPEGSFSIFREKMKNIHLVFMVGHSFVKGRVLFKSRFCLDELRFLTCSSNYTQVVRNESLFWVNYNDLTVLPHWNHGEDSGNHPQMALIQISELL